MHTLLLLLLADAPPMISASTTAQLGGWTIAGQDGAARHLHGGPPAQLGEARFQVDWEGTGQSYLTVTSVEFLTGHGCDVPPTTVTSRPSFGGLFVEGMTESTRTIPVSPGHPLDVEVGFASVDAYMNSCDRFAFRVHFLAGSQAIAAVAETVVTRETPAP